MELLGVLCLIVVGLIILAVVIGLFFELIGDAFEAVLDIVGPIGALVIGLVVLCLCCGGIASAF